MRKKNIIINRSHYKNDKLKHQFGNLNTIWRFYLLNSTSHTLKYVNTIKKLLRNKDPIKRVSGLTLPWKTLKGFGKATLVYQIEKARTTSGLFYTKAPMSGLSLPEKRQLNVTHKYLHFVDGLPLDGMIFFLADFLPDNPVRLTASFSAKRNFIYYLALGNSRERFVRLVSLKRSSSQVRGFYHGLSLRYSGVISLMHVYFDLLQASYFELFLFKGKKHLYSGLSLFRLYFTFKTKRFFINLATRKGRSYLSLAPGLFVRFLDKRKSFKKNRAIVLLMGKYLRKLFLIIGLHHFDLIVRQAPYLLNEILASIFRPLIHRFTNPFKGTVVDENETKSPSLHIRFLLFQRNKPYNYMKSRLKGRVKRKILRKVVRYNRLVD